jgi:hypothetical protein
MYACQTYTLVFVFSSSVANDVVRLRVVAGSESAICVQGSNHTAISAFIMQ